MEPSPRRVQFSLRWLFVIVAVVAVCAWVYRLAGLVESLGVSLGFILCGICLILPKFRFRRSLRGVLLATASLILWMVGIDYSLYWEGCEHCLSHWDVEEIRVFHQPVWSRQGDDHSPALRLTAEDLGAPCPHDYQRWHKWRLWGLFWPGPPFFNGTCCLTGGDWYHGEIRGRVQSLAAQDPGLGEEFRKQGLLRHNPAYLQSFYDKARLQDDDTTK
jgi:hypothetical protein